MKEPTDEHTLQLAILALQDQSIEALEGKDGVLYLYGPYTRTYYPVNEPYATRLRSWLRANADLETVN